MLYCPWLRFLKVSRTIGRLLQAQFVERRAKPPPLKLQTAKTQTLLFEVS